MGDRVVSRILIYINANLSPSAYVAKESGGMAMHALVVDEDARSAYAIELMLRSCGLAVERAASARQGLNLAGCSGYDILLTDLMLSDMSGCQLMRRMRSICITSPILVTSRLAQTQARAIALEAGADGYIAKPFSRAELLESVARLLPTLRRRCRAAVISGQASGPSVATVIASVVSDSPPNHIKLTSTRLRASADCLV